MGVVKINHDSVLTPTMRVYFDENMFTWRQGNRLTETGAGGSGKGTKTQESMFQNMITWKQGNRRRETGAGGSGKDTKMQEFMVRICSRGSKGADEERRVLEEAGRVQKYKFMVLETDSHFRMRLKLSSNVRI